jgi:uncharacterized membrane protein YdjX (TVP38/TMEM64 family)
MMSEIWLTGLLTSWRGLAIPLSLLIEVAIAVAGVIPSFFITAANVAVFGIWWGTALSIAGESLGAVVAFMLYRRGLEALAGGKGRFGAGLAKRMSRLSQAPPERAFLLVLAFRLLPYVPSGAVTAGAAGGRMKALSFTLASTLGKIPALAVEVATVSAAMKLPLKGFLALAGGIMLVWVLFEVLKGRRDRKNRT